MDNTKNRIVVEIAGTVFTVVSNENERYTKRLAEELTSEIAAIRRAAPGLSLTSATMLTALNCADRAAKAETEADSFRIQVKDYLSEAEKYRENAEKLSAENEKLKKDIETLRKRLGESGRQPTIPAPVSKTVRTVRTEAAGDEAAEEITDFFEQFESRKKD